MHDKSLPKLITAAPAPNTYFCLFIKVSHYTGSQIKTPITAWFAQWSFAPLKSHVQRKGEKEHGMTWVNLSKHPPPPNQKSCSVSSTTRKTIQATLPASITLGAEQCKWVWLGWGWTLVARWGETHNDGNSSVSSSLLEAGGISEEGDKANT